LSGRPVDLREVLLRPRPFDALNDQLRTDARERLRLARDEARGAFAGRTIWWINSTSQGGGIAEMLRTLLPYWLDSGVDTRWLVLTAPSAYFRLTKRLHNLLHGVPERPPSPRDRAFYESVARSAAVKARSLVRPGDIVILEDPQTAGLVEDMKQRGTLVVWRSHVGPDDDNLEPVGLAWEFLLPFIEAADAFVFTRRNYIPSSLEGARSIVLPPAIDPLSAKNQVLVPADAEAILHRCGLARARRPVGVTRVPLLDGRVVEVRRRCRVMREEAAPQLDGEHLVVALARWDWLKDPVGIVRGFAKHVSHPLARLIVAGPATGAIADDPGARRVLQATRAAWRELSAPQRRRVDVVALPMVDLDENALMVNALQREAAVVVKKSVQEGFGLGVTEGLWKARPVVATRVGGHRDQIEDHRTGLLIDDPTDLRAFGAAIDELLADSTQAQALASAGREHVRHRFLADCHFVQWATVLREVLAREAVPV
jgi:trehalose synthase